MKKYRINWIGIKDRGTTEIELEDATIPLNYQQLTGIGNKFDLEGILWVLREIKEEENG